MHLDRSSRFLLLSLALTLVIALSATGCKDAEEATGYYAVAEADPAAVSFGVATKDATVEQQVSVAARSADFVVLESWELAGEHAGDFEVAVAGDAEGPWAIEPGAKLSLTVRFTPGAVGDRTAELVLHFSDGAEGYHVLGGGCASDPNFGEDGTPLRPEDLVVPLSGTGAEALGGQPCTDEDEDGYQILVPPECDPWVNVPPGGGPPKLEPPVCDKDENRHPGQDDPCDGTDDDCDGGTDEDFVAEPIVCGVGECQNNGITRCVAGVTRNECVPLDPPTIVDETCDSRDDDCDGQSDEDFDDGPTTCGEGACAAEGEQTCVDGVVTDTCAPGDPLSPDDATCDGVDDDCDGRTDEEWLAESITCGTGVCERTAQSLCMGGDIVTPACMPGDPLGPTDPTCDAVDDDCDGATDEDFQGGTVTCGLGVCQSTGSTACEDGEVITVNCVPGVPLDTTDPTCDGVDDDCDGQTDEDYGGGETTCGLGVCERTGTAECVDGAEVVVDCTPGDPLGDADPTCDGLDDDCDGQTDEEFEGAPITCGVGACERQGGVLCVDGAVVDDECVPGEPLSDSDPTCDGVDDDCDGLTDEDYEPEVVTCGTGACVSQAESACVDGVVEPGDCVPLDPPVELDDDCDNVDDDCDGETDEDFVDGPTTCGEGVCARDGTHTCVDGEMTVDCTPGEPAARDELCTDLDEDCDGFTDEDLPLAGDLAGTPGPGAACAPIVPIVWDGTARPAVSDVCLGFTTIDSANGSITVTTSPALETGEVGPGVEVRDGALWTRTLPVGVQLWYELEFTYPIAAQTVGVQMTMQLDDYLGDIASPGAALYLSNGVHGVWLNVVRDGVWVYTGEGDELQVLGFVEALTQSVPHTIRLVLADDAHVRVEIDGADRVTFPNALATAALDALPRVRFGDWSATAGAIVGWDELALFNLPTEQLDQDGDGASVCDGDCDDTDGARSHDFVDDVCTTVDEDCNGETGLGPTGELGLIGGPVVDSCRDAAPSLWDGTVLPEDVETCLPFLPVESGAEPTVSFQAGALRLSSTGPTGVRTWTVAWPDPALPAGTWVVARARVRVEDYVGSPGAPGNALFVANGANRVWLNIAADTLTLVGAAGPIDSQPFDASASVHEYVLAIAPNGDVLVNVDGRSPIGASGAAALGEPTTAIEAGFGDATDEAGATALWDDFGFFALAEEGLLDVDSDGVTGCGGDCDDRDPFVHPGQGELPGDGVDQNCDGDPDDRPYCSGAACVGPLPDPDPVPGTGGCYRVFEYPDGWNGDRETLNMGQSGGTLGDIDLDGIADFGFNHDDEVYLRFGEPAAFGLGVVPEDPLAVAPTGIDVVVGSLGEPVSQLGLSGVTGGDLNGDGINDVVIGTRFATDAGGENVGRVYVFIGREEWDGFYDASEANLIIEKSGQDGWTSSSVTAVNDLNGDGLDEIGIKTKDAFTSRDRFYVFFGDAAWDTATSLTLTNDDADVRYIDPVTYFVTGVGDAVNIASAGDFDGDGYNDMAFGTPGRAGGRGAVWLVFGGEGPGYWPDPATPAVLSTQANVVRFDRTVVGAQPVTGAHVAQGGDLNGDGLADVVYTGRGALFIVPGRPRAQLLDDLGVDALGDPTVFYDPFVLGDYVFTDLDPTYPFDMAYTGDVDGDGYDDVLVSTGANGGPGGDLTNVSYLLYGGPVLDWPQESAIRVTYDACFHHGESLVSAHVGPGGDFNADGKDDMVFAAPLRQEVRVLYGDWY